MKKKVFRERNNRGRYNLEFIDDEVKVSDRTYVMPHSSIKITTNTTKKISKKKEEK